MANIISYLAFDQSRLNLNLLIQSQPSVYFFDDFDIPAGGGVYADWVALEEEFYITSMGGSDLTVDADNYPDGGLIEYYEESYFDYDNSWKISWSISDISHSAYSFSSAMQTSNTLDDHALMRTLLSGDDVFKLSAYDDVAFGFDGRDLFYGGAGSDTFYGGNDKDRYYGGEGADYFVFETVSEIGKGKGQRDAIKDWQDGSDIIALSVIDAGNASGVFEFIGTSKFSGTAGELRYFHNDKGNTSIQGDVDGDGKADFNLKVKGSFDLDEWDFIL